MNPKHGRILVLLGVALLSGCAENQPSTQPVSAEQRQDAILNDPMYKPNFRQDITGGDITTFDRDGFNRDLNHALSP